MKNVCRPFVLYNDFLPPSNEAHMDWDYLSFGYYDGLTVDDNLFIVSNNQALNMSLPKLWDYYVKSSEELNGSFSSQIIFGLRTEDEHDIPDEVFWSDENRSAYPFLFVSLIQAKRDSISPDSWKCRKLLEKELNDESVRAITYLTFDTSDILLVMLCEDYTVGAKIIDSFHEKNENILKSIMNWELNYSFTIAAVNKKILNDNHKIQSIKGMVESADIYLIEKEIGSIHDVYHDIKKQLTDNESDHYVLERTPILGCNDEVIKLSNVPWNKFLLLFQDETGILNHSSKEYFCRLIGATTIIGVKDDQRPVIIDKGEWQRKEDENTQQVLLSELMRKKCLGICFRSEEDEGEPIDISGLKRNLFQVINSLQKFETTPFRDYLFQTALLPLNMMLNMAKEVKTSEQQEAYIKFFYDFMKGFNLYVQDSSRSDRQFTQVPDFNAKIYDTPVKVNAFYNAFIFNMKKYLNSLHESKENGLDNDIIHEYEFLACPGITDNMQVEEYFVNISEKNRLFLAEIPENQVYKPKEMLTMLAHEVGHFVGKDIRNREERYNCIRNICAKIVVKCIQINLKEEIEEYDSIQNDRYWKYFEEKIGEELIKKELEQFESKDIKEQKRRKYHSDTVVDFLAYAVADILRSKGEDLWAFMLEKDYIYWLDKRSECAENRKVRLNGKIKEIVSDVSAAFVWEEDAFTIVSSLKTAMKLFKECIADLVCILTLKLSIEDYLNAIIGSAKDQGMEADFDGTAILLRSGLVADCMLRNVPGQDIEWTEDDMAAVYHSKNKTAWISIQNLRTDFLNEESDGKADVSRNSIDIFYDSEILMVIAGYLEKCKKDFFAFNMNKDKLSERQQVRHDLVGAYKLFDCESIEQIVLTMQKSTDDYLNQIRTLNREAVEDGI